MLEEGLTIGRKCLMEHLEAMQQFARQRPSKSKAHPVEQAALAHLYLEAIPDIETQFITLAQASKVSLYSQEYLNVLARRGAIPAFKLKRNRVVTKESLLQYVKAHQT